jgi:tRNA splicing endonuclease
MNKLLELIGQAITSMAAVIFVLMLTIFGLITFTHTLFMEVLPISMSEWEKQLAAWVLSWGWEFSLLLTTCNTQFLNRKIPVAVALASGVIVLFFIDAFNSSLPVIEICKRIFIGLLISTVNYIFTELFYSKWKELQQNKCLSARVTELEATLSAKQSELIEATTKLDRSNLVLEKLTVQVTELEEYKKREIEKLTCPHCQQVLETIYKLTSHKGQCLLNPNRGQKSSAFDDVASNKIRMIK